MVTDEPTPDASIDRDGRCRFITEAKDYATISLPFDDVISGITL
jgi:hypothetical protein